MIVLDILQLQQWSPLSKTKKFDRLFSSLSEEELKQLQRDFASWTLHLLRHQVRQAIKLQKFPIQYKPLSAAYKKKKYEEGLNPGFWISTGFLNDTIRVWYTPSNNVFHIGWPPTLMHPSSKEPVASIAARLEKGSKADNLPPRPLFTLLAKNISKSIAQYFTFFISSKKPNLISLLDS